MAGLRRSFGELDGLGLLRALMNGPLRGEVALVSSYGSESAVLLDMVASVDRATPVIFLETGKLFPETLEYQRRLSLELGLVDVRLVRPDPADLDRYDTDPGSPLSRRDPDLCCHIRKTEPLERALEGFGAWITGRKRFQGGARSVLPAIEGDPASGRIKLNPLVGWSADDIRHYRRLRQLPPHPLVVQGYASIGCAPCTRPVREGEPPRAGRWWGLDKAECGIHGDGI
ncbi:MAG TPA: phosphoadenylyl-sulfate reductase [Geminicoccaceae bacterium]|nr:phosphoadenylyl-sulfate reductase [Geminicoccaceae bacterium]